MKGKTKFMQVVRKSNNGNKKLLIDKCAVPVFTMFIAPVEIDNPKSEDMVFGYTISGDAVLGMGEVINNLKGITEQIEKDLFAQMESNEEKA